MPKRDENYMADRRDEILDAAVRCLLRTGLAGLSTTAICKEAGVSMGALYTHFSTKEDVIQGIAVRAGHHCAQPILRRFGVESTVRPSLALYNTCEEIDALVAAIWNLKQGHNSL